MLFLLCCHSCSFGKQWHSRSLKNTQICNKIDALVSSFETAGVTALFYLKTGVSLYKTGRFHNIERA